MTTLLDENAIAAVMRSLADTATLIEDDGAYYVGVRILRRDWLALKALAREPAK
jgi:hypothetical protein